MRRVVSLLGVGSILAVGLLAAAGPGAAVGPLAPQGGLVLHYPMETLVQGTVADDSGSALDGHVVAQSGAPRLVASLSGYGKALALTGAQHQYVDVPRSPLLDVDTYTLSAWVRYTGVQNDQTLDRWEVLEKAGAYWINIRTDGKVRVGGFFGGCTNPAWQYLDSNVTVPVGTWTHVAGTYNGSTLAVWVNGVRAGSRSISGTTCQNNLPLAVGAKSNPAKGLLEAFWDGALDDVRIYRRALTAAEIRGLLPS
jgi:hypothetical protein